jgi:protein-tyrosine-phosphatase
MTNILFICKFNKFRSQVAEAYFNQINKNKNLKASSAGFILPLTASLQPNQVKVAKQNGVIMKGKPKSLTAKMLQKAQIYIIVADDIPPAIINAKKYHKKMLVWKVKDSHHNDEKNIKRAVLQIKNKVENLVRKLG